MKHFFNQLFLLLLLISLLFGCVQSNPVQVTDGNYVSFTLSGEIVKTEEPITKASSSDIYLVQTYQNNQFYGTGIFDSVDNISIYLKSGFTYRFVISVLRNGKERLDDNYSSTNNSILPIGTYYTSLWNNNMWWAINYYYYKSSHLVAYYSGKSSTELKWSSTWTGNDMKLDCEHAYLWRNGGGEDKYPLCEDWLYGEINNYSPTGEFETLNMELKRVGFKLKYELTGVTDGEVTVKVYNSDKTFINNTTNTSTYSSEPQFYAFYEARNAWLYSDEYMENMTLAVSWKRGVGITESFETKTIQIKRNCLNNIKINLGSNDQQAGMNMTVESESTIGAAAVSIPVE